MTDRENQAGYEASDVRTGLVWIVAAGLVVSVVVIVAGVAFFFNYLHHRNSANHQRTASDRVVSTVAETQAKFPEPRLQVAPQVDLANLLARENAELNTYGWIDQKAGIVRLPIERAMDLLVERGLPTRGDPNAPKPSLSPLDMQQSRPLQRDLSKEER